MEMVCSVIEILASFTESVLILSTVIHASGPKLDKRRTRWSIILSAVLLSLYLYIMNTITAFSFLTPIGTILLATFVIGFLLSTGKARLRAASCILALFVIQSIDYIVFIGMALLQGSPRELFDEFMRPGYQRVCYLLVDKGLDIAIYTLLRNKLIKLSVLRDKVKIILLNSIAISYIAMQYLFVMVMHGDFIQLQGAAMISFFILLCFLFILVFSMITLTASEKEKATNMMLGNLNQMMEENYYIMNQTIMDHAKAVHDFHHHLSAICALSQNGEDEQIPEYIRSVLSASFIPTKLCRSGCSIVDAVINSKLSEAEQKGIKAEYEIHIHDISVFEPADLCAVMSNQIENALEACDKLEQGRRVWIDIRQQANFVLFRVINPVAQDPFLTNHDLASTKTDTTRIHGIGLRNLHDIAKKYNGAVKSEYVDGRFISTVLLCLDAV